VLKLKNNSSAKRVINHNKTLMWREGE